MDKQGKILLITLLIILMAIVGVGLLILNTGEPTAGSGQNAASATATKPNNAENEPAKTATQTSKTAKTPPATAALLKEFQMTARQWEFEPSTITVNRGDRVRLKITSEDVAHGLAIPQFKVNSRLEPGQETVVEFTADQNGTFTFFCSIFCGAGHSGMRGTLVVK